MIKAGVRDLKDNLSRYLTSVKNGDRIVVTEHGRPIARIVPVDRKSASLEEQLAPMVADGTIRPPVKALRKMSLPTVTLDGALLSETVIRDRR